MAVKFLNGIDVDGSMNIAASDVPNLDASKITSGTFSADRIPTGLYQPAGDYLDLETANTTFQPIGNYLTSVPSEYLTQTEGDARYLQSLPSHSHDTLTSTWQSINLDTLTKGDFNLGFEHFSSSSSGTKPPINDNANAVLHVGTHSGGYWHQLAFSSTEDMYYRATQSNSIGSWRKVWDSGNLTNVSQLTNDSGYLTSLPSHNHDTLYDAIGSANAVGQQVNERIDTEVFDAINSKQPAGNYFTDGDTVLNMANNDGLVYNDTNNTMYIKKDGTDYAIIDAGGGTITGTLTLSGGGTKISMNNGDITGVNQILINDPGEGIVWTSGSSGNITLAVRDDASDNTLNLTGTGAALAINGLTVATQSWVSGQGYLTSIPSTYATDAEVSTAVGAVDARIDEEVIPAIDAVAGDAAKGVTAYGWGNHASAGYITSADGGNADTVDGYQASQLWRRTGATNATAGGGWVTVAHAGQGGRWSGEVIVTDGESGDHSFIRIHWMRSYQDSNFTVLNCGGHANRITGARVLYQTSDSTYGWKYLQVYVTTSSNYYVRITQEGDTPNFSTITAVTPVVENTKTGYAVHGSELTGLENASFAAEEGIKVGGTIYTNSHGDSSQWNTAYGWGNHASAGYATTGYVDTAVSNLVDTAPAALNTLNELAAALGDDANFSTTVANNIGAIDTRINDEVIPYIDAVAGDAAKGVTAYSWGNHAGLYLGATAKAADSNLLDGINSTSFLRSDQADTMSGTLTITGSNGASRLRIEGTTPTIDLDDADGDSFYIHVNSNNFYVLADRDGGGDYGTWDSPHPLQLEADTNSAYVFGNKLQSAAYAATTAFDSAGSAAAVSTALNERIDTEVFDAIGAVAGDATKGVTAYSWGDHSAAGYLTSVPSALSVTSIAVGSGATLTESTDRADLLMIKSSTSTWGGLQVSNTSNEIIFSLMGDNNTIGLYDDLNNDWVLQRDENGATRLYHNAGSKLSTTSTGISVTGEITTTGGNSTNWNTAYGWGNHASAGYLTSIPSDYVRQGQDIVSGNIHPVGDREQLLGLDSNRWQIVFCEILDSAGQHEKNLQNPAGETSVADYATGTVMVWENGKNVPCTTYANHMRMGIAVENVDSPMIQGAEPVLVTGSVSEGDYLVTSTTEGHAVAVSRDTVKEEQLWDCVIGKALEGGEGESHLIKTWVTI